MPEVTLTTGDALKKFALRQPNERLVLNVVRQYPSVSRADIVHITGLSPSSVTFIVQRLEREKMLREVVSEPCSTVRGQPTALRLNKLGASGYLVATGARSSPPQWK